MSGTKCQVELGRIMRSLVDVRKKASLRCGAMLEEKHCFKLGGVISCRNMSYYDLLGKTMEQDKRPKHVTFVATL